MNAQDPIPFATTRYETDGPDLTDMRVFSTCLYALGFIAAQSGSRATDVAVKRIAHVHDHKGDLYVAYYWPISMTAQHAFTRAWQDVGGEPIIYFVQMGGDDWEYIWSMRRGHGEPPSTYHKRSLSSS